MGSIQVMQQDEENGPITFSNKYLKFIMLLLKKLASILLQVKTGHTPLAKHLNHIGKTGSLICPACQQVEETVQHFMLHCPAHNAARQNNMEGRDINIMKLFTTAKTLCALFTYIAETGRWHSTFGDLPTLEEG